MDAILSNLSVCIRFNKSLYLSSFVVCEIVILRFVLSAFILITFSIFNVLQIDCSVNFVIVAVNPKMVLISNSSIFVCKFRYEYPVDVNEIVFTKIMRPFRHAMNWLLKIINLHQYKSWILKETYSSRYQ
jgi:hypothetical protein